MRLPAWKTFPRKLAAAALAVSLAGCSAQRIFYYPNRVLYADPHNAGFEYELVDYPSLNGRKLYAMYFKTAEAPKGVIVHFHGNFGNMSNHFPQAMFLLKRGFDVLVFDYQGFGGSEGRPSPKATVEDGIATVRWAKEHLRDPAGGIGVFGQSIGAAVATVTAAKEPLVDAAVLEAGFTTYRSITRAVLRRSWLTWPLAWVFPPLFVRRKCDPVDFIGGISPRPVLILHGTKDETVPVAMARELFAKAKEPKRLWVIDGGRHLGSARAAGRDYDEAISKFFEEAFAARGKEPE